MLDAEFAGRLIVTIYLLPEQCFNLVSLICMLRVELNHLQNYRLHSFSLSALACSSIFEEEKKITSVCRLLLFRTSCSAKVKISSDIRLFRNGKELGRVNSRKDFWDCCWVQAEKNLANS